MTRITVPQIIQMKGEQKISMLTCYDATFARLLDQSGVDIFLVGDTLGNVIKGEDTTLNVTVDEIAYHTRAVARGSKRAHIVGDMPFLSYQASDADAIRNAGALLQAGAQSVKLEGGVSMAGRVRRLTEAGIPVMGHIGVQPQSVNQLGGYVVQGKNFASAERLLDDAAALEAAGAFAIVLECVTQEVAAQITEEINIPTIGIGAGPSCDGQVLVIYDLLNLNDSFTPKFVEHFAQGGQMIVNACTSFVEAVKSGSFPTAKHSYSAPIQSHVYQH